MGLLDQVLGQVIGGMMGGRRPAQAPNGRQGGFPGPDGPSGGGLGDLLGGGAGKYSPLVSALIALLASKGLNTGGGPHGSMLQDILGRVTGAGSRPSYDAGEDDTFERPQRSEYEEGPSDEEPRYREDPRGRRGGGMRQDSGGGFLDSVGSLLDGPGGAPKGRRAVDDDLSGGELGPVVGNGLGGLLDRFRQNGRGDLMESWIGGGANKPASPHDLDQALGSGAVDELARRTGLGRDELLSQLSQTLPQVVDGLTPHGRLPEADEHRDWV